MKCQSTIELLLDMDHTFVHDIPRHQTIMMTHRHKNQFSRQKGALLFALYHNRTDIQQKICILSKTNQQHIN